MRSYQSIGIVWASSLVLLCWVDISWAVPPSAGLTTNSLDVRSRGGRYRPQRPTISPYLALAPGGLGSSAAINYFSVVRPEITQRQVNQQQGFELYQIERQLKQVEDEEASLRAGTKPDVGFMTHRKYFFSSDDQSATQSFGQFSNTNAINNANMGRR
jgi:hypothetical protein